MSYKKFERQDIFYNTIKTKPAFKFKIYDGKAYLNNSTTGYVSYADLNLAPTVISGCVNPNSFDFSCEDNSFNVGLI